MGSEAHDDTERSDDIISAEQNMKKKQRKGWMGKEGEEKMFFFPTRNALIVISCLFTWVNDFPMCSSTFPSPNFELKPKNAPKRFT